MALKPVFRTDLGGYMFTNRVVDDWNRLGEHIVSGESIGGFKDCIQDRSRWILVHLKSSDYWNRLGRHVVSVKSIGGFKLIFRTGLGG